MNVTEISMDKTAARKAFEAYRAEVHKRHGKEDEAIMRGYRALSRGKRLIHLTQTIKAGGTDTHPRRHGGTVALPRLAICRAHVEWCWISTLSDGSCIFRESEWAAANARRTIRRMPAGTLGESNAYSNDFRAMVPVVPAALRPGHHLRNYYVLWEADWKRHPPIDPYLLKHIFGDLYAIVAHWDLTELERAVMSERVQ